MLPKIRSNTAFSPPEPKVSCPEVLQLLFVNYFCLKKDHSISKLLWVFPGTCDQL